jgi:hypothetical protein
MTTPSPTQAERAREVASALIDAVISAYHTTRISDVPVAVHILNKPMVQYAFDAFAEQSRATDRIAVVEECARVAEAECTLDKPYSEMIVAAQIAAAIRALSKEHNHVEG